MATDPLSISSDLRAAGFSEAQANVLATHLASRPDDLVTKQDLDLATTNIERRIDGVDHKVDGIVSNLLLKLGGGMAVGFGLLLTAFGIGVAAIISQLG